MTQAELDAIMGKLSSAASQPDAAALPTPAPAATPLADNVATTALDNAQASLPAAPTPVPETPVVDPFLDGLDDAVAPVAASTPVPDTTTPAAPAADPFLDGLDDTPTPTAPPSPELQTGLSDISNQFQDQFSKPTPNPNPPMHPISNTPKTYSSDYDTKVEQMARERFAKPMEKPSDEVLNAPGVVYDWTQGTYTDSSGNVIYREGTNAAEIGGANGFSFGTNDEIAGAIETLNGKDAQLKLDVMRKANRLAAEESPLAYYTGTIVGSIAAMYTGGFVKNLLTESAAPIATTLVTTAPTVAAATKTAKALGVLRSVGSIAGKGAVGGGIMGFTDGEDGFVSRIKSGAVGATTGAVLNLLGAGIGKVAVGTAGQLVKGARNISDRITTNAKLTDKFSVAETEVLTKSSDIISRATGLPVDEVAKRIHNGESFVDIMVSANKTAEAASKLFNDSFKNDSTALGAFAKAAETRMNFIRDDIGAAADAASTALMNARDEANALVAASIKNATPEGIRNGVKTLNENKATSLARTVFVNKVKTRLGLEGAELLTKAGVSADNAKLQIAKDGSVFLIKGNAVPDEKGIYKAEDLLEVGHDIIDGSIFKSVQHDINSISAPDIKTGATPDPFTGFKVQKIADDVGDISKSVLPKGSEADAAKALAERKIELNTTVKNFIDNSKNLDSDSTKALNDAITKLNLPDDEVKQGFAAALQTKLTSENLPVVTKLLKANIDKFTKDPKIAKAFESTIEELNALGKLGDKNAINAYETALGNAAKGGMNTINEFTLMRQAATSVGLFALGSIKGLVSTGLKATPQELEKVASILVNGSKQLDEAMAFVMRKKVAGKKINAVVDHLVEEVRRMTLFGGAEFISNLR